MRKARSSLSGDPELAGVSSSSSSALALPPHLPARPKLFVITREAILRQCRTQAFENVVYLNLHGCSIRKIEMLGLCLNLRVLVLTFPVYRVDPDNPLILPLPVQEARQ